MSENLPAVRGDQLKELASSSSTLVRLENDKLQAVAVQRPRDVIKVRDSVFAELEAIPEIAETAWYCLPRGDKKIEGPTVNTARRLAQAWGNCLVEWRIIDLTDDSAEVRGVAIDLQSNYRYQVPLFVSRYQTVKGQMKRLNDDMWNNKIKAAGAKAMRNAIFGVVPEGLVNAYVKRAQEIVSQGVRSTGKPGRPPKSDSSRREKVLREFNQWPQISEEILESLAGGKLAELSDEGARLLWGIRNSLKEGGLTEDQIVRQYAEQLFSDSGDPVDPEIVDDQDSGTIREAD